ncbi:MAG TPA: hypothetical protein VFS43_33455 [Polyangiaceae bacterium]|nr:hypothetical protein [Polyangiaceae bacterium]
MPRRRFRDESLAPAVRYAGLRRSTSYVRRRVRERGDAEVTAVLRQAVLASTEQCAEGSAKLLGRFIMYLGVPTVPAAGRDAKGGRPAACRR